MVELEWKNRITTQMRVAGVREKEAEQEELREEGKRKSESKRKKPVEIKRGRVFAFHPTRNILAGRSRRKFV